MGSHRYYPYSCRATVHPVENFNAAEDAAQLRAAMKGFGTDEKIITNILAKRGIIQRLEICAVFKKAYCKDLIAEMKSELGGHYEDVIVALMTPLQELYAKELYHAMKGPGTDEEALIEIMCPLSNFGIRAVAECYEQLYGKSLEKALADDTSGHFRRLLVALCQANRCEDQRVDLCEVEADAQMLYDAGAAQWGTDKSAFNRILVMGSYAHLKAVFEKYEQLCGVPLERAIKEAFSGSVEKGLLAIVACVKDRTKYYARKLHQSMAGLGTDDRTLIRIIVGRAEIDLAEIKVDFQNEYGKSLQEWIKGDTSGNYKKVLLAIID